MKNTNYIAVKLRGFAHYIWFDLEKTTTDATTFTGKEGWGKGGAYTSVECDLSQIQGRIYSDEAQYA